MLGLKRFLLADEQSFVPRSLASIDGLAGIRDPPPTPPSASLYSERMTLVPTDHSGFPHERAHYDRFWRKRTFGRLCTSLKANITLSIGTQQRCDPKAPNRLALACGFGRSGARWYVLASFNWEGTMAEAKLAPNLPDWMLEHANRYLASGGTDGQM